VEGRTRKVASFFLGLVFCGASIVIATQAAELDTFGPPPANDCSAQTGPFIGMIYADNLLQTAAPANEGALILEGGVQGDVPDIGVNNSVPAPGQSNGSFNIPTNSKPSPGVAGSGRCFAGNGTLFPEGSPNGICAQPFTQQMLLFEEFGPEPLDFNGPLPADPFPQPTDNQTGPAGPALEAFLAQNGIGPIPTRVSNTVDLNPWKTAIESFLGRPVPAPPAEGRPPGEGWSHQRWNEFKPQAFFNEYSAAN